MGTLKTLSAEEAKKIFDDAIHNISIWTKKSTFIKKCIYDLCITESYKKLGYSGTQAMLYSLLKSATAMHRSTLNNLKNRLPGNPAPYAKKQIALTLA